MFIEYSVLYSIVLGTIFKTVTTLHVCVYLVSYLS